MVWPCSSVGRATRSVPEVVGSNAIVVVDFSLSPCGPISSLDYRSEVIT